LIDFLPARGKTTQDLLTNLFKGYLSASDKVFVYYIGCRKLKKYEEGDPTTADGLMEQADNKFKLLKVHNKWNAPSQEEEKILALEARVCVEKGKNQKSEGAGGAAKPYECLRSTDWVVRSASTST
jgi:hypothetical protein